MWAEIWPTPNISYHFYTRKIQTLICRDCGDQLLMYWRCVLNIPYFRSMVPNIFMTFPPFENRRQQFPLLYIDRHKKIKTKSLLMHFHSMRRSVLHSRPQSRNSGTFHVNATRRKQHCQLNSGLGLTIPPSRGYRIPFLGIILSRLRNWTQWTHNKCPISFQIWTMAMHVKRSRGPCKLDSKYLRNTLRYVYLHLVDLALIQNKIYFFSKINSYMKSISLSLYIAT